MSELSEQHRIIVQNAITLIRGIKAALQTEESGMDLIKIARAACEAEMRLASFVHQIDSNVYDMDKDDHDSPEYVAGWNACLALIKKDLGL